MTDSVTVRIDAPVDEVWALITDISRIGEFSPETFEAEWLRGATGPELGARFRGHVKRNKKGPTYWAVCEVTELEEQQRFGFAVLMGDKHVNNWRYRLSAEGDATVVTESFWLSPTLTNRIYWTALGRWRNETNRRGMQQTLERMKAVLESTG